VKNNQFTYGKHACNDKLDVAAKTQIVDAKKGNRER
jgi:hypothetical protein